MDKGQFCRDNPADPACQGQSSFGGTCTAGYTCSGDAAMCATAKASYETNCALNQTSAESALYEAHKNDAPGGVLDSLNLRTTTTLSASSFDQTDLIGGAAGMQDTSIDIAGRPFLVEFSRVNTWLQLLGYLGVAVTMLLAIRIVFRG
jgi:hypothetical protein